MRIITLRNALILAGATVLFFALGAWFNSRCEGTCIEPFAKEAFKKNHDLFGGNFHYEGGTTTVTTDHEETSTDEGSTLADLPSLDGVESIQIQSVSTEWNVGSSGLSAMLNFADGNPKRGVKIRKDGKKIFITVRPDGPKQGSLQLPGSYSGGLTLQTVSGEVHIGKMLELKTMKIETASGDVDFLSWPTDEIEINTVSGDVQSYVEYGRVSKRIELHSVSGDFHANIPYGFEAFAAETVSGDVRIAVAPAQTYSYKMRSVSGDFTGLPAGGDLKDEFGDKEQTGKWGNVTKSTIKFESVSGDFHFEKSSVGGATPPTPPKVPAPPRAPVPPSPP